MKDVVGVQIYHIIWTTMWVYEMISKSELNKSNEKTK